MSARRDYDAAIIEVVCLGNICRSPYAQALLRSAAAERLGPDQVIVRSSGLRGLEGDPASEGSVLEAARRGLDLSAHVGARLAEDRIREADLVITMSQDQRDQVVAQVPGTSSKVFAIRELVRLLGHARDDRHSGTARERIEAAAAAAHAARPFAERANGPEDVADPYGGPPEGYARMAAQLDRLVLALADDLFGPLPDVDADLFGRSRA